MNKIHDTLVELRRAPGIKGTALVTSDGLMAAKTLDARFREDVVAGLTSFLTMTTAKTLKEGGFGTFTQFTLHATNGKALFVDIEGSYLVVLLDQFADLDGCRSEIHAAAQQLRRSSKLG